MRLLTFVSKKRGAAPRVGVMLGLDRLMELRDPDMLSVIRSGRPGLAKIRKALKGYKGKGIALSSVRVLAPIPRPAKNVFCVGWNYLEHFEEGAKARPHVTELPSHPTFFTKAPTAVNGPYDRIPLHPGVTAKVDWEVELGVVIGKCGANIKEADAMKYVFGYTVINDVSAREVQRRHGQQWFKGKSLDGHCPMGPWIVTADTVKDWWDLRVVTRVIVPAPANVALPSGPAVFLDTLPVLSRNGHMEGRAEDASRPFFNKVVIGYSINMVGAPHTYFALPDEECAFKLDGQTHKAFSARVRIWPEHAKQTREGRNNVKVNFEVHVDGKIRAQSGLMDAASEPRTLAVDNLSGAKELKLVTRFETPEAQPYVFAIWEEAKVHGGK